MMFLIHKKRKIKKSVSHGQVHVYSYIVGRQAKKKKHLFDVDASRTVFRKMPPRNLERNLELFVGSMLNLAEDAGKIAGGIQAAAAGASAEAIRLLQHPC